MPISVNGKVCYQGGFAVKEESQRVVDELKAQGFDGVERKSGFLSFNRLLESMGDYPFFTRKQGESVEVYAGEINLYLGTAARA